ncbi:MAG: hypothetical protein IT165_03775 [Bryobacterales bacterium]|nr:hypothetical protein [Bryobacterales bacterium]
MTTRRDLLKAAGATVSSSLWAGRKLPQPGRIKSFCIDFNWHMQDGEARWINSFAKPGHWAGADPQQHVEWYAALGANVIQTFAVSCNGYAWYKEGAVPPQPGLKHDFLPDMVRLGHKKNMLVTGYFCAGANTRFAQAHPDLSYGTPSTLHIPFTDEYLAFLSRSISDAVRRTGMDGFMIDWIWNPNPDLRKKGWIEAEQKLYTQLTGKPFPAGGPPAGDVLSYERKAMERCWHAVHKAAKDVRRDCIVWLSCSNLSAPTVAGAAWLKEADWVMNESPNRAYFDAARKAVGQRTRMIQCLVGWVQHDAGAYLADSTTRGIDLYGFAEPRDNSLPLPVDEYLERGPAGFPGSDRASANDRNIAALARFYRGMTPR